MYYLKCTGRVNWNIQCTVYSVQEALIGLFSEQFTVYMESYLDCTVNSLQCTGRVNWTVQCTVYSVHGELFGL